MHSRSDFIPNLTAIFFFTILSYFLFRFNIVTLAGVCIPILAIFFGFTSLLYNRARALPSGAEQRRSLYAAERAMQATILYFLGLLIAASLTILLLYFDYSPTTPQPGHINHPFQFYFLPIILMAIASKVFVYSLQAVANRLLRRASMRRLIQRLK